MLTYFMQPIAYQDILTMSNSHYLTLGQAAKLSQVAKSTITRAIDKGHLSVARKVGNSYRIDPAELQRWQETRVLPQRQDGSTGHETTPKEEMTVRVRNAQLEAELTALKEKHAQMVKSSDELKDMTERMLSDKDKEIERLYTLALTDQRQNKTFWGRLFKSGKNAA